MEILCIIPARGGSKSIPKKNIVNLCGKPLIAHSITQALQSKLINRCIVTTDSEEIAKIAKKYGAIVPFIRPLKFAQDNTPDLPVFQHTLKWLATCEKYFPDIVVHLRPTAPIRRVSDIDKAISMLIDNRSADSLRSICAPSQSPFKMWKIHDGYLKPLFNIKGKESFNLPRQKLPTVYWQNASIDVIRYETIMNKNSMSGKKIIPFLMDKTFSIDIDDYLDLKLAELVLTNFKRHNNLIH
ncbi:MAG: acylneuraminate cytidylyltransferase family protein [Bacteroidetes bacterium]|nr:acylneuraminate cytidylyltransferase family protein [Bacteroidota bacterium]